MEVKLFSGLRYCFIAITCLCLVGCEQPKLNSDNQVLMGTFIEVKSQDKRASQIAFKEIKRIEDSLIGQNVTMIKSKAKPAAYRIMVGDSSRVEVL